MFTHILTLTFTCSYTQIFTLTDALTHSHTLSHLLSHSHTLTHILPLHHTCMLTRTRPHTFTFMFMYTVMFTHILSHAHTHTVTLLHSHIHIRILSHSRSHSHMLSTHKQPHSWADLRPVPAGGLGGGSSGETALWGACVEGALALQTCPQLWPARAQQERGRVASSPVGGPGPESLPGGHGDLS